MKKDETTLIEITDPLIDPYFILRDQYGYSVNEVIESGDGRKREIFIGSYRDLGGCLKAIAKGLKFYDKKYDSVQKYLEEWEKQKERIEELIKTKDL